jgi:CcmD family protein
MATCITAYLVVGLAVLGYVLRLGVEQRRLRRLADALQMQRDQRRLAWKRAA